MPDTDLARPISRMGIATDAAVPFNLEDVRAMAAKILRTANEQAQRKLMAAEAQAQEIEKTGYQDGHEKGYAAGQKKGEADGLAKGDKAAREAFQGATKGVAGALAALLAELQERKVSLEAEAEADLLRLALAIARRLVRRELALDPQVILPIVREAIGLASSRSDLVVRLHPGDLKAVESELPALRKAFADLGKVQLEADAAVEPGGVIVAGRDNEVDMRLERQFAAIERALVGLQA